MTARQLETALIGLIPIVRMEEGKYLIGTCIKQLVAQRDRLMILTGGGCMQIDEHL